MVYSKLKRVFDFVISLSGLIVLSPIMMVIAVAVRSTSSGPAFFCQQRLGRNGCLFLMYKFRTMYVNNSHESGEVYSDNPSVTNLGRFLRRSKLDELPQLYNVFRGDLSLIGPRAPLPDHLKRYSERVKRRLNVRPGMTGLAQVHGNIFLSWEERWAYDVEYVDRLSARLDIKILVMTIILVFSGEEYMKSRYHHHE